MKNEYTPAAFPILEISSGKLECTDPGMTLCDYFAARAMEALINKRIVLDPQGYDINLIAKTSYMAAYAMLEVRKNYEHQQKSENPHRALLLQIHTELSHVASADADPANWEGYALHRIEKLLWPEGKGNDQ